MAHVCTATDCNRFKWQALFCFVCSVGTKNQVHQIQNMHSNLFATGSWVFDDKFVDIAVGWLGMVDRAHCRHKAGDCTFSQA